MANVQHTRISSGPSGNVVPILRTNGFFGAVICRDADALETVCNTPPS
jgi:hypothetical protein